MTKKGFERLNSRENAIIAQVLKEMSQFVYECCLNVVKAPINNISLIPIVFDEIIKRYDPLPENSPAIIAIIYKLYAPYKLHLHRPRVPDGIRTAICQVMKWDDAPLVNYYNDIAMAYYKGERWAGNIDRIAAEILTSLLNT